MLAHGRALLGELAGRAPAPPGRSANPYDVFLTPNALAIKKARQEHLASLGLDLQGKRVLEVGAGIGLHNAG